MESPRRSVRRLKNRRRRTHVLTKGKAKNRRMISSGTVARGLHRKRFQRMQRNSGGPGEKHVFEWKSDVEDRRRREIGPHGSRREGASDRYWKLEEAYGNELNIVGRKTGTKTRRWTATRARAYEKTRGLANA